MADYRIPSPDSAFEAFVNLLPRRLGSIVWNVTYAVAWVTLPVAFISSINDLTIVVRGLTWVYDHLGSVARLVDQALPAVHAVVAWWRDLTAPLREWILEAIPFRLAEQLIDLMIVMALCLPSIIRWLWAKGVRENSQEEYDSVHGPIRIRTSPKLRMAEDRLDVAHRRYIQAGWLFGTSVTFSAIGVALIALDWIFVQ